MAAMLAKYLYREDRNRKILIINPTRWLDRRIQVEYFGNDDEDLRLKKEVDKIDVGGIFNLTQEEFKKVRQITLKESIVILDEVDQMINEESKNQLLLQVQKA